MKRREFVGAGLALAAGYGLSIRPARAAAMTRVRPGGPGWPADSDWAALNQATNGRLFRVESPKLDRPEAAKQLSNPFFIGDQPALTQSSGWLEAWQSSPSAYAVAAESTADVVAAVRFARDHNLRLAIKGRGHKGHREVVCCGLRFRRISN